MARKKISRKQLKQPDEFITYSGKVIQWGQKHYRQISLAAIVILGIIVAAVGYRYIDGRSELKGFTLLSQASRHYTEKIQGEDTAETAYEAVKPDFENILDDYAHKDAGKMARKTLADICFNAGQYDRAIALYQKSLKDFKKEPFYHSIILGDLALAYEANNNEAEAIQYFQQAANAPEAAFPEQALFHLASLYEKEGKSEQSRKLYEKIIAEYTGSIYTDIVKERISG